MVGLKKDLRDGSNKIDNFVRETSGVSMAKDHNLVKYIECSSLTGEGVKAVFATIALEAAKRPSAQKAAESV